MNILVLGAAVSGCAAARLGRRLGHAVTIYDENESAVLESAAHGYAVESGIWDPGLLENVNVVVTSPGIPEAAAPLQDTLAADLPLWSEMEFAARHLTMPYLAVTGTNGKTTVTTTTVEMLRAGGVNAVAAGNIGTALSDVVGSAYETVVVEASSFQLRFVDRFHAEGAAILNVTADHLDWHGTYGDYAAAKARIFERQQLEDFLVFNTDDHGAASLVTTAASAQVAASGCVRPPGGNGPEGKWLVVDDERFPKPTLDRSFLLDMTIAATLAHRFGATYDGIAAALSEFTPGMHRRQHLGIWGGVTWINDSKATNPEAAIAAASAYESVVLIAGGRNKGLNLAPLVSVSSIQAIIGIGEAREELRDLVAAERYHEAVSMGDAVRQATEIARTGDVVLLAPGCASFDMFENYADRGDVFASIVLREIGGHGAD